MIMNSCIIKKIAVNSEMIIGVYAPCGINR